VAARNSAAESPASGREIVIARVLNFPRELVFTAWTDPKHARHWWGPTGFRITTHAADIKPGGAWRFTMHGPDGTDYPNKIVFIEIVKPERMVYKHTGDKDPDPEAFETTVTFEEQGGKTKLTMRAVFASAEARNLVVEKYGAIEGGNQTLDRLTEYLATM
jgi:uncharacterized protein YndB with AHSA1/START domain